MEINSYLLREALPLSLSASGPIGSAVSTVDVVSAVRIRASAALTLTLPTPSDVRNGRSLVVLNAGTNSFSMYGIDIAADQHVEFYFDGGSWHAPKAVSISTQKEQVASCTALRNLRNAGSLVPGMTYCFPHSQGNLNNSVVVTVYATAKNKLSDNCEIETGWDLNNWRGALDVDTCTIREVLDNRQNHIFGVAAVNAFPWGNGNLNVNKIYDGTLNYSGGVLTGNTIEDGCVVTVTAGTLQEVTIKQNALLSLTGGGLYRSEIREDAEVYIIGNTNYDNFFGGSCIYRQVGTGYIRYSRIVGTTTITSGNVNIYNSTLDTSTLNTTGSNGNIQQCFLHRVVTGALTNIPSLSIIDCEFTSYTQLSCSGATRVYLNKCTSSSYGRFLVSANAQLDANYVDVNQLSYVQVIGGRLYVSYSTFSNYSYAYNQSNTNRIDRVTVTSYSRIRFLNSASENRVYYCQVTSGSYIEARGTSRNCYFYYCEVSTASNLYTTNAVNLRCYYNHLSGNSQIYSNNTTGTSYIYYCSCTAHGYIRAENGVGGRIYAVSCTGQGLVTLRNASATGRLYYSSFNAYYYLFAVNWTVTRYALHGYGRRSYTVTNPAANGTFTQNF